MFAPFPHADNVARHIALERARLFAATVASAQAIGAVSAQKNPIEHALS